MNIRPIKSTCSRWIAFAMTMLLVFTAIPNTVFAEATDMYTVTFDSCEGSPVESVTAALNTTIAEPETPYRTGYQLDGWYREPEYATPWIFDTDTVTQNMTLYAKWVTETYTVTFDSCEGSPVESVTAVLNTTISEPETPSRIGYQLDGWYREPEYATPWIFDTDTVTQNMTLYAKWVTETYTVTFDTREGSIINSISAAYNTLITQPQDPQREGFTFGGWYKEELLINLFDFHTETIVGDITLYAKWDRPGDANQDGYDDHDFDKLQAFLNQPSATTGLTNGKWLNDSFKVAILLQLLIDPGHEFSLSSA